MQARSSIDWTVYVCIAFAFAMSTALEVTNVAQGIADIFTRVSRSLGGKSASFCAIYAATALLSGMRLLINLPETKPLSVCSILIMATSAVTHFSAVQLSGIAAPQASNVWHHCRAASRCLLLTLPCAAEIVSNNAAGALMYPIAARLGDSLGVDPTQVRNPLLRIPC